MERWFLWECCFIALLVFVFAAATIALIFILMFGVGLSGKTISIAGVVVLKVIQPLITNRLFLKE